MVEPGRPVLRIWGQANDRERRERTAVEEARVEQEHIIRSDGKEKVTGTGRYTADLTLAGQLLAKFRYADHTHARIVRIDAAKARALPGVLAVVTHEDVPDVLYGGMVKDRRLFARDTVRFEGDIVAAVAATRRRSPARSGTHRDRVRAAARRHGLRSGDRRGAPLVHPDWDSYEADDAMVRDRNTLGYSSIVKGDVDAAMASADVVVRDDMSPIPCKACRSSHGLSSQSGTATRSRSGRRRRCHTPRGPGSRGLCRCRSRTSA